MDDAIVAGEGDDDRFAKLSPGVESDVGGSADFRRLWRPFCLTGDDDDEASFAREGAPIV